MKKIILIFITFFLVIGNASASEIESDLVELKNSFNDLKQKVNNLETARLDKTYPIGSIYITTIYSTPTQVADAIGGTWESYGSGRTLVGVDENDTDFNIVNKTGGTSTTILTTSNLPSHTHSIPELSGLANNNGAHTHSIPALSGSAASAGAHTHTINSAILAHSSTSQGNIAANFVANGSIGGIGFMGWSTNVGSNGAHTHTVTTTANTTGNNGEHSHDVTIAEGETETTGESTAISNLQPYITVYMYKRVA